MIAFTRVVRVDADCSSPDASCESAEREAWRSKMSLGMIVLIVLVLVLLGVIPTWPHSRQWGYYPSGGIGLVLLIIVILLLLGKI
jgi:hypothetical protein